ncbi:beta-alanine-activating enzyme [Gastrophryne carolinensis]
MEETLHRMVREAAALHKDRDVVCFQPYSGPPVCCTYKDMMHHADELTCFLKSSLHDLQKDVIGIYCQPGIHLASWIMGILQVPAAYFPIDPSAPSHFTTSLMKQSQTAYILVENSKVEIFKQFFPSWIQRDSSKVQHLDITLFEDVRNKNVITPSLADCIKEDLKLLNKPNQDTLYPTEGQMNKYTECVDRRNKQCLAYILHTSGSTGTPKVVSVPHCCIVPNIQHLRAIFSMSANDLVFLTSPLTFDPSVIELFLALSVGACLLIAPEPLKMIPQKLCSLLFQQHRVTVLQATPTFLKRFSHCSVKSCVLSKDTSLRVLALGGEQFPPISILRSWREPGNRTRIFNLYGITEVSSWATYYEIPESLLNSQSIGDPPIPLGKPLHGSVVEVRNEENNRIEEGEGEVLLGGSQRVCFVNDELVLPLGTMRRTGDWVRIQDGDIYYVGRKDNQFKRNGKRLNTEYIQQIVEGLESVEACAAIRFVGEQLVLFVVSKESVDQKALWRAVQTNLLSYAVPDDLLLIDSLPLTKHGKLDLSRLKQLYDDHLKDKKSKKQMATDHDYWSSLQTLWKAVLGFPEDFPDVTENSVFLLSGGDSLKAVRLHDELEILVGRPVPGLFEVILNDTIMAVLKHITTFISQEGDKNDVDETEIKNRDTVGGIKTKPSRKRKADLFSSPQTDSYSILSLSRGSRLSAHGCQQHHVISTSDQKRMLSKCSTVEDQMLTVSLKQRWVSDTSKCVDASPLVVCSSGEDSLVTVYIGSHSHRMQALDLHTGTLLWERILGDRIESSAALSVCGNYIVVGCYDGGVYALRRSDGATHWLFNTGDAVKSSPAIDPQSGLLFVGSHDQHLYALDIEEKQCVWRCHYHAGAIFSSPCISAQPHHLYLATLGGQFLAVAPATGKLLWKADVGKPVFSSPQCSQDHVFFGCVDAMFYCLSHWGEKLWQFRTEGPIFSSPCLSLLSKQVTFGSHDGFVYCCSMEGQLVWKYETSSRVYATPFVFPKPHAEKTELLAAAATDGGLCILDACSGAAISHCTLGGEIFSSPVVCHSRLLLGCRNNYLYCFDLISQKQNPDSDSTVLRGACA